MNMVMESQDATISDGDLRGIGLVDQLLRDQGVSLVARAVDNNWFYRRVIDNPVTGFNPYSGNVYYAAHSALADWLSDPAGDLRSQNESDFLIREVLFAAHDYLHAWCVDRVNQVWPELRFGSGHITRENAEMYAFCHLFTEAVATVGLDYWYLACNDLEGLLGIGTMLRTLTVSYDESRIEEYRRFHPGLNVQDPEFLWSLSRFYCTGRFPGFRGDTLKRSPAVLRWLRHELTYGALQRRYTRQWLNYLAPAPVYAADEDLAREIEIDEDWCAPMVRRIARELWAKVKDNRPGETPTRQQGTWAAPENRPIDFRFVNTNAYGDRIWDAIADRGMVDASFESLFSQVIASSVCPDVDPDLMNALAAVKGSKSCSLLKSVVAGLPKVAESKSEPRDLFVLA